MIKKIILLLLFNLPLFAQEEQTIKLLFLGDIMGHGPQIKAAYNNEEKTYNYDINYQYVRDVLSDADVSIGNLEVTLGVPPYKGYPQFSSPPELARDTKFAGIDILVTANNHSCDKRKKGIEKTIEILDSLAIQHTGTFKSQKEKDSLGTLIINKKGFKIALLSYTYGTNGIPVPYPNVVNHLDEETIRKDIANAKAQNPDQIIAFVHWGNEYQYQASTYQKKWFNFIKGQGVNIVIGSHPHVVQPMEWDKDNNTLVVYSLGNFVSNQRKFPRDGGALFELTLTKKDTKTSVSKAAYIATWVYKRKEKNPYIVGHSGTDYMVLPINNFEYNPSFFTKKTDYDKMMRYTKHLRNLMKKNNQNVGERKPVEDLLKLLRLVAL